VIKHVVLCGTPLELKGIGMGGETMVASSVVNGEGYEILMDAEGSMGYCTV